MNCGGRPGGALELVDHLAFGDGDPPERHGKAEFLGEELDVDLADADLADEGMGAAIAALGRIAERQQEALVAARQGLQPQVAVGGKGQRLARQVADAAVRARRRIGAPSGLRAPSRSVTRGDGRRFVGAGAGARRLRAGASASSAKSSSRCV